jgi:hypothetical protein
MMRREAFMNGISRERMNAVNQKDLFLLPSYAAVRVRVTMMRTAATIFLFSICLASASAFVATGRSETAASATAAVARPWTTTTRLRVVHDVSTVSGLLEQAAASSWWVATIDSDIAKIPENEFAPVFLGGMAVMLGGVLSAAFVGTVVDQKNLYGQLVVDSYLPDRDDQAFWKELTEEERLKVKGLLERMAEGKEDGKQELEAMMAQKKAAAANNNNTMDAVTANKSSPSSDPSATKKQKEMEMFSDYAE